LRREGDVKRFAFYGRVSTEDQQDPQSSRAWQLRRSKDLINPSGGVIVAEFFDVGQSRAVPWKRRPQASCLLESFREGDRAFEAVVIGEPQRAFYGAQFALTFPLFEHYGVELWVPEIGGHVDPGSEAHDLLMTLFGGMSKGERARVRTRVRAAMAAQAATEGRFLGGRPPYGYRLADAGPHPTPAKAAQGIRLHALEPDPLTAPVVVRIFEENVSGRGLYAIAEGLTRDEIPSPAAYDRRRNPHRSGEAWSKSAVRAILLNARYTGISVWGRQRREEVLLDVEDVAAGHRTKMMWNAQDAWIRSVDPTHEPLISRDLFEAAQERLVANRGVLAHRKPRAARRPYLLRRLIQCGLCQRRMQGNWNNGQPYYRCRYPSEYALANRVEHPKTVYVRQAEVVPALDRWLATVIDPEHVEETCEALAAAQAATVADEHRLAAAGRTLAECDEKLGRYRAALEAGTDPAIVTGWIRDVAELRRRAEREARSATVPACSADELRALIEELGDMIRVLEQADPTKKAELYESLGLNLVYHPQDRRVTVEADLSMCRVRVGGGI
jgi:site-specific DNA recombinase